MNLLRHVKNYLHVALELGKVNIPSCLVREQRNPQVRVLKPDVGLARRRRPPLGVAAQAEFESNLESDSSYLSFKSIVQGAFNMDFIGSTCTALPWRVWRRAPRGRALAEITQNITGWHLTQQTGDQTVLKEIARHTHKEVQGQLAGSG
jgi:hypothetical protein